MGGGVQILTLKVNLMLKLCDSAHDWALPPFRSKYRYPCWGVGAREVGYMAGMMKKLRLHVYLLVKEFHLAVA